MVAQSPEGHETSDSQHLRHPTTVRPKNLLLKAEVYGSAPTLRPRKDLYRLNTHRERLFLSYRHHLAGALELLFLSSHLDISSRLAGRFSFVSFTIELSKNCHSNHCIDPQSSLFHIVRFASGRDSFQTVHYVSRLAPQIVLILLLSRSLYRTHRYYPCTFLQVWSGRTPR